MTTMTLPPGPSLPRFAQGAVVLTARLRGMRRMRARYGDAFTVNVPIFGRAVVISDPDEAKQLFTASTDLVENVRPNLGRVLGPGSLFALTGEEHREQRRLLVPPFHGRRLAAHERTIEDETVRETATWPEDRAFPALPSMLRITLNAILRAVFGADGDELADLREMLPAWVAYGSRLLVLPIPKTDLGRWSPWGRLWIARRRYDAIVDRLIDKAAAEDLDRRDDVLALLLQSRYDDGSPMSRAQIADHLLSLLVAGHETTATTLAWAIERLRRHPALLRDLAEEADAGGGALREATITEVQRTRPVIDVVGRHVTADGYRLGRWTLPEGCTVLVAVALMHEDEALFPDPLTFDPSRFLGVRPDLYQWIPFGGGRRRCPGAAFATMEMNVVLRTVLRHFTLMPTTEPGERRHSRGVANAPAKGGVAVVRRRSPEAMPPSTIGTAGARP
ncbi:cytochrome P450 [Actinoallomurus soli]|uniref:cytochrome P450 n=1 Tax=Actinoallomurus soli TaxID=2952535 RepID=UPI00209235CC|nr:cytochrome P450 [Actinoallomurus soli]MCO5971391.1 cytochrome P450 [Actinoallomurus soli]